jgi:hypothetical protein
MAKELPYFKFEPSEWITGDITLCSMEAQGLFINLCCYYWLKGGSICLANAKQRFSGAEKLFEQLIGNQIISIDEAGRVSIKFLDEQMEKFIDITAKRSESGKLGGKANAKQMLSKSKANDNIGEERRGEKIKEYTSQVISLFESVKILFPDNLRPAIKRDKDAWCDTLDKLIRIDGYTPEHILNIVRRARTDPFWSKNFLSLRKLRDNNKQGVRFFKVFENLNGSAVKPFGIPERQRDYATPQTQF